MTIEELSDSTTLAKKHDDTMELAVRVQLLGINLIHDETATELLKQAYDALFQVAMRYRAQALNIMDPDAINEHVAAAMDRLNTARSNMAQQLTEFQAMLDRNRSVQ